jgi:hypothetical protein
LPPSLATSYPSSFSSLLGVFPALQKWITPGTDPLYLSTFLAKRKKERKNPTPRKTSTTLQQQTRFAGLRETQTQTHTERERASKRGEANGWMICLRKAHEDENHCSTSSRFGVRFCESLVLVQDFDLISIHHLLLLLLPRLVKADKRGKTQAFP